VVGHLILVEQDFARAVEGRREDEAAAAVVERSDAERRQQDGRGGFFLDRLEAPAYREGAEDAAVVDEQGGVAGSHARGRRGGRRRWGTRFVPGCAGAFGAFRGQDGGAGGDFGLGGQGALASGVVEAARGGHGGMGAGRLKAG
jgi:hypothetical protein